MSETYRIERQGDTPRAVLEALHDDADRYFDGTPFELASLTAERVQISHSGHSQYAAAATYRATTEGETPMTDHQPLDLDAIEERIRAIRKTLNPHKSLHDQGAWNTLVAIEEVIDPHEENIPRERQERAVKSEDLINQRAEARTSTGHIHARGRIIAYTDRPTYLIETDTGERISWIADMTHPEPPHHDQEDGQ